MIEKEELINKFRETLELIQKLNNNIPELQRLISGMESNYNKIKKERESRLAGLDELEAVLMNCNVEICKYRKEFDELRKKHKGELDKMVSRKDFHFFLCYRGDYYTEGGKSVIEAHKNIIDDKGFCWWGKFVKKREPGGIWQELEPFGESIRIEKDANMAVRLKANIAERLNNEKPVYLFNFDPNPPNPELFVSKILDFSFEKESIPPFTSGIDKPSCAFMPPYYFLKGKKDNCNSCKSFDANKCMLQFKCNFWFKIDKLYKLTNIKEEFSNLINCFTDDTINFAVPILYPLLVTQKEENHYFDRITTPIPLSFQVIIPEGEKGHSKEDKIKAFFDKLNELCGKPFGKVIQTETFSTKRKCISVTAERDMIIVNLPPGFRRNSDAGISFKITLDENTTDMQKEEIQKRIQKYFASCIKAIG